MTKLAKWPHKAFDYKEESNISEILKGGRTITNYVNLPSSKAQKEILKPQW